MTKALPIQSNLPKIPIYSRPNDYSFVYTKLKSKRQSPTEKRIAQVLKSNNIEFIQECSFQGFGYPNFPYRFDFYLPKYNLIIEYDGKHHLKNKVKVNDKLKNKFCKLNKIKIIRYNIKHYINLEEHVKKLIKTLT